MTTFTGLRADSTFVAEAGNWEQQVARRLLGEAYAVTGHLQQAALLWSTVDMSLDQPSLRQWWYESIGEPQRAAWIAEAAG